MSLAWKIRVSETAAKQLSKLGKPAQKKIVNYLRNRVLACDDPHDLGGPLKKNLSGLWRYRVSDYRIIVKIQDNELIVLVLTVGHRSKVYGGH